MEPQPVNPSPQPQKTNGLAIASLVVSIIGCGVLSILAIIFGHISRGQIKRDPSQKGDGMALAGLIIGYLGIVAVIAAVIIGAIGSLTMPAVSQMRNEAFLAKSKSNAKMVTLALLNYETTTGNVAQSLDDLVPDYLQEPMHYVDPETQEELPFEYFTDRASIPFVLASPRPYRENRIVVYQDGRLEEIPDVEYLDRVGRAP